MLLISLHFVTHFKMEKPTKNIIAKINGNKLWVVLILLLQFWRV